MPKINKEIILGIFFAFITLIGDSFQTVINNSRPPEINALIFAWITSIIEFLILFPFFLITRARNKNEFRLKSSENLEIIQIKDKLRLLFACILFAFCAYFLILGFSMVDSVMGILAIKSQPISMIFIGSIMLKEKLTKKESIIGLTIFILMFYTGSEGTFTIHKFSIGFLILLIVPIFWNIGHAIAKPFLQKNIISVNEFVFMRIGVTSVILSFLFLVIGDWTNLSFIFSKQGLISLISMGFLFSLLHNTWYQTIKRINISIASFLVLPSPIITVFLVFLFTKEPIYSYHYIGIFGVLICLSILILIQKSPNKMEKNSLKLEKNKIFDRMPEPID